MVRFLKFIAYLVAAAVVMGALGLLMVYLVSSSKLEKNHTIVVRRVAIPTDPASIERGKHIAETRGCIDCHGSDYGGAKVIDAPPMGKLYGSNLTKGRGSVVGQYRDEDWIRSIRHGVARDGRPLVLMPSAEYAYFSDDDLSSVIAYLKTVPPVDRDTVPVKMGPVARGLMVAGKFKLAAEEIDHANLRPSTAKPGVTLAYGRYLAIGCTGCHGTNLAGGKIDIGPPDWPLAANLTPHESGRLGKWTEADFVATLRTAKRPDGTELSPVMPRAFGNLNDVELKALWLYLKSIRPVASGTR
ncbi:MAG TPA: c-type cytochrome [Opitutaceae bacterium]|nr:c-type cytochrome [Opitutaceae bacterium]